MNLVAKHGYLLIIIKCSRMQYEIIDFGIKKKRQDRMNITIIGLVPQLPYEAPTVMIKAIIVRTDLYINIYKYTK